MEIKQLSKEKEDEVVDSIKTAIGYTNDGMSPSEAIQKVASAKKFNPELTKRMVEVFNNSKTLAMFKDAGFDRTTSFPIADAQVILNNMYPDEVDISETKSAAACLSSYIRKDKDYTKKAAVKLPKIEVEEYPRELSRIMKQADANRDLDIRAIDTAKFDADIMYEDIMRKIASLKSYFTYTYSRPFDKVESEVLALWGETGKQAMDTIYEYGKFEKSASVKRAENATDQIVDEKIAPLPQIAALIKTCAEYGEKKEDISRMEKGFKNTWDSLYKKIAQIKLSLSEEDVDQDPFDLLVVKSAENADILGTDELDRLKSERNTAIATAANKGATAASAKSDANAARKETTKAQQELRQEKAKKITPKDVYSSPELIKYLDPDFERELKGLKMSSLITDLITNDPVLSEEDPDQIITLFNELSAIAPSIAAEPIMVRSLLRYYVNQMKEGGPGIDRFEINNILDMEKRLRENRTFIPEVNI
jgi:hypothetical protein